MATQQGSPAGNFRIAAGGTVGQYLLVKTTAWTAVVSAATSTDVPVGTVQPAIDGTYTSGTTLTVRDVKSGGTHKVIASGAITKGANIFLAAGGKVSALPAGAGTYKRIGIAAEAASGNNSIIEAWLNPDGATESVGS